MCEPITHPKTKRVKNGTLQILTTLEAAIASSLGLQSRRSLKIPMALGVDTGTSRVQAVVTSGATRHFIYSCRSFYTLPPF
eukprot:6194563-Amphidinium_carterae.2